MLSHSPGVRFGGAGQPPGRSELQKGKRAKLLYPMTPHISAKPLFRGNKFGYREYLPVLRVVSGLGLPATPQEFGLGLPAISWEVSTASEQKKFRIPKQPTHFGQPLFR